MITENDRAEQRKRIKYNHLVANCLIFHNVYEISKMSFSILAIMCAALEDKRFTEKG